MEEGERVDTANPTTSEHHLCVLVHGLWGSPHHLDFVASCLRDKYPDSAFHILACTRNSGNFTYDGIETGGERVTQEIEESLEEYADQGQEIKKLSIVGYSLGGLVARYAIGLLYSKGWFERIEPVNFVTFASPYLGVRTPALGIHHHVWNIFGARTLSMSGRQLFLIDDFRQTGRPLLALLADSDSIFIRALASFKTRTLYANIINDRTAVYYTTGISRIDPFASLDSVKVNYVDGFNDVIVDSRNPVSPLEDEEQPSFYDKVAINSKALITRLPTMATLALFIPVGTMAFLVNSVVQSIRSSQRIRLHEAGQAGIGIGSYRIPLMVENVQSAVEGVLGDLNQGQREQEYLPASTANDSSSSTPPTPNAAASNGAAHGTATEKANGTIEDKPGQEMGFPTLALAPAQFKMIETLDALGFHKHPVHIHHDRHSHAAIITRWQKKTFDEGREVMRHWLENEFVV